MHTWTSDWAEYVKICHCKEEFWSPSVTLSRVIMKGFLWIEAYEAHCHTGNCIDHYSLGY